MSIALIVSKLISEQGVRKTELSKHLGVARNTLDDYLSGKTFPTSDKIVKMSTFFNVPVSYLFGETNMNADASEIISEYKKEIEQLNLQLNKRKCSENLTHSLFLAIPIDSDEFLDLREMKDKIIKVLKK